MIDWQEDVCDTHCVFNKTTMMKSSKRISTLIESNLPDFSCLIGLETGLLV